MNCKKIVKIFLSVIMLLLISLPNVNAFDPTKEQYVIKANGEKVYYYKTANPVTVPKEYLTAEYEMRGVWVATVYNIAISPQGGTTEKAIEKYKAEFISILDRMEEYNMNTLYFQVRPSNDAFYESELNTWSQFLAGAGVHPGWDPLEWMIEETHKRGFVFQCWMNAFRVTVYSVLPDSEKNASFYDTEKLLKCKSDALNQLADGNFAKENPDCVVMGESDTRLILNPSDPRVQQFLVDTVVEIIENYDVDGLHFDDYFYLSGGSSNTFNGNFAGGQTYDSTLVGEDQLNDLPNYQAYLQNKSEYSHLEKGLNLGDFRRASLNHMIKSIHEAVTEYNEKNNKVVEFGAKPAGVWRSNIKNCDEKGCQKCSENGSNTHPGAYTSYGDLFADSLNWVQQGWVDYIAPQVYYGFSSTEVPYADIVDWWAQQVDAVNEENRKNGKKEVKLYIAHGIYKYEDEPDEFAAPAEINYQLLFNKKYSCIKGSAFYSYEHLYQFASTAHEKGMNLVKKAWNVKTIPLPIGEYNAQDLKIENYSLKRAQGSAMNVISFDSVVNARAYAVYKVLKGQELNTSDVNSRILVEFEGYQENKKVNLFIDNYDEKYDYYVKVFSNQYHMSEETLKIDFEKTEEYIPLEVKGDLKVADIISISTNIDISFDVIYNENGTLKYEVFANMDGKENRLTYGECVDGRFTYTWKSYPFPINDISIKVVFSDGTYTKEIKSNEFDIKNELKITYNLNGGNLDLTTAPTKFYEGEGLANLPIPTKKGYEFGGWYLNGVLVESIDADVYSNVVLVAKWNEAKKGCKKAAESYLISSLCVASLGILIFRKKK